MHTPNTHNKNLLFFQSSLSNLCFCISNSSRFYCQILDTNYCNKYSWFLLRSGWLEKNRNVIRTSTFIVETNNIKTNKIAKILVGAIQNIFITSAYSIVMIMQSNKQRWRSWKIVSRELKKTFSRKNKVKFQKNRHVSKKASHSFESKYHVL